MFGGVNFIKQENEVLSTHKISAYQISLLRDFDKSDFKFEEIKHDFIHESVKKECKVYKIQNNIEIFQILNLYFLVIKSVDFEYDGDETLCNGQKEYPVKDIDRYFYGRRKSDKLNNIRPDKDFLYYVFVSRDNDLNDYQISMLLRGSKTLKFSSNNRYIAEDIHISFAEKGFLVVQNFQHNEFDDKIKRLILLFLIGLAYKTSASNFIDQIKDVVDVSNIEETNIKALEKIRDDFCFYNIKSFFLNPVKQEYHQSYKTWDFIAENYNVREIYNESKKQISELASLVRGKQDKKFEHKMITLGIFVTVIVAICSFLAGKYL
ncbi:hypothetical protein B9N64_04475 [Campylobacter concisus]|uniref:hypothetical protein n=1 Tax=Campylobacter concisus TaxID=199 RepID=UPI000B3D5E9C|nr:hypothetical protein [Campylobacter concisus]OUT14688.1 hypothetical protein B9N64_04475 [Campylobacter concisus]